MHTHSIHRSLFAFTVVVRCVVYSLYTYIVFVAACLEKKRFYGEEYRRGG